MANAAQLIQAGFARGWVHLLDTAGYPVGIAGKLANGEDAGAYELKGIKTADLAVPEPEKTNITGNNRFMGAFTWPISEAPSGSIEASVYDHALNAALEGTKVYELGGMEMSALGAKEATQKAICMVFQSDAYSQETGYVGLVKKFGILIPKASAVALGPGTINERGEINSRLALTIQMADTYPWGAAIELANQGATEALMLPFSSDYWVEMHAFVGDGEVDEVVLDYTPAGDHTASPARVLVFEDGVPLTPSTDFTVNTSTKTVKFDAGSIPAAGVHVAIWYEHE